MRNIFNIILILFTLTSLYLMRGDIVKAYKILNNFFVEEISSIDNNAKTSKIENELENTESQIVLGSHNFIETPGALRVGSAILHQNGNLTHAGVIVETNNNRMETAGLPPLKENQTLNAIAKKKVEDMFAKQYFEHISPSGVGVSNLADKEGYEYIIIGENLALGNFKNDEAVLTAWMNSPGHRANILNTHYTEIGVAVASGTFEGKVVWLAVQHFGLPKDACPKTDDALKIKIQSSQKRITTMQKELTIMKKNIDSGGVYGGKTTQEQITIYNEQVNIYNSLIAQLKISIEKYNTSVNLFNSCVQNNT